MNMSPELESVYDQQKYGIPTSLREELRNLVISTVKSMKWHTVKGAHYVRVYCEFTVRGQPAACYSSVIGAECRGVSQELLFYRMTSDILRMLKVQVGLEERYRLGVDSSGSACNITPLKPS